jgi:hypothetical protein
MMLAPMAHAPCRRVPTPFGGKRLRVGLTHVFVAIGKLDRGDRRHY